MYLVSLLALLLAACSGGNNSKLDPSLIKDNVSMENLGTNPDGMPLMTFDKTEHNFGTITEGEDVETKFTFTNTGDADLIISNATGDCGCTVPQYPKEPIKPGQKSTIVVSFKSSGKVGENTKRVTITTNAADAQSLLTIKASVIPKNK
jgi:hypothetical protein